MKNTSENNCLEDTKKMRHSSPQDVGEDNCNEILIDFHKQQKKYAALKKTLKTKGKYNSQYVVPISSLLVEFMEYI